MDRDFTAASWGLKPSGVGMARMANRALTMTVGFLTALLTVTVGNLTVAVTVTVGLLTVA